MQEAYQFRYKFHVLIVLTARAGIGQNSGIHIRNLICFILFPVIDVIGDIEFIQPGLIDGQLDVLIVLIAAVSQQDACICGRQNLEAEELIIRGSGKRAAVAVNIAGCNVISELLSLIEISEAEIVFRMSDLHSIYTVKPLIGLIV